MKLYNPKNVWRLQRPHQTYSHNLHFKITELARRFDPETLLRQDTLLLYNPKECGESKKVYSFFLLENSRPLSPWGPLDSLSTCLGNDSLTGKDWGQEEKGTTEDEMAGWHHRLDGHVWVNSRSWWWTGRPGVLQFMGSQRVGNHWATKLSCFSTNFQVIYVRNYL